MGSYHMRLFLLTAFVLGILLVLTSVPAGGASGAARESALSAHSPNGAAAGPSAAALRETGVLPGTVSVQAEASRDGGVALASGVLRDVVERAERGQAAGSSVDVVDGRVRVEVVHDLDPAGIAAAVAAVGGTVVGEIAGLVEALVPVESLVALEAHEGIRYLRPPLHNNVPLLPPSEQAAVPQGVPVLGQEVVKTNADDWHAAGYSGFGVKVGIVDVFDGTIWNNAQTAGELPAPAGTFCRLGGVSCSIWTVAPGVQHGQAVAEIVHEMAPNAQLYLATVDTAADLQAAVDYFAGEGVNIISRSLTSQYDGPGDGTGPTASVIDNAVAAGMVWFNSAGNAASDGVWNSGLGQYWRGTWADGNGDGWMDFAPGDEFLGYSCTLANGLRWSDFGDGNPTDYDVCVFDSPGDPAPIQCSTDDQGGGALPLELNIPCREGEVDFLAIQLYDAGGGVAGDTLEFMVNGGALEYWQNPHSASGPAADTFSPGALTVGAVDPALGTSIAPYSSQGPTNDARIKPNISAAACVNSYTYAPVCFDGTSAATPAVAGAAALLIEAGVATTPAGIKTYLQEQAAVDRGAPGTDNLFGHGELVLPAPPVAPTNTPTPTSTVRPLFTNTPTPTNTFRPLATHTPTPTNTPRPLATYTPTGSPGLLTGDVDCDGETGSVDALWVLWLVAGTVQDLPCLPAADVNRDGVTNAIDAQLILQYVAGLIPALPV